MNAKRNFVDKVVPTLPETNGQTSTGPNQPAWMGNERANGMPATAKLNAAGAGDNAPAGASSGAAAPAEPGQPEVRGLQKGLKSLGYDPGPIDGVMSPSTQAAIKKLQQANGLPADGRLNPPTQAALAKALQAKG